MLSILFIFLIFLVIAFLVVPKSQKIRDFEHIIRTLDRQCRRWLFAANQDQSPMVRLLHTQYGMGYIWAIADICPQDKYEQITGNSWQELTDYATKTQDDATRLVAGECPQFIGKNNHSHIR